MSQRDIRDLSLSELETWVHENDLKPYAVTQIVQWLYDRRVQSFDEMTNLSKQARDQLTKSFDISHLEMTEVRSASDGTVKFGFRLSDGAVIESVLMPQPNRVVLCVSSQVGCAMGCTFCKTASMKLIRNLTQFEILGQVIDGMRFLESDHERALKIRELADSSRATNIVFMGMGEPLHNLGPVVESIRILLDQRAFNFAKKRVLVSTCGLVPQIIEYTCEVPARLAVSLNAADDKLRSALMPVNQRYGLDELMSACRDYEKIRGHYVTFEYVLIRDINDSLRDAAELVRRVAHTPCKINLIPLNEYPESPYRCPSEEQVLAFHKYLADRGFQVNIRSSKGADAMAACGQLAQKTRQEAGSMKQEA